MTAHFLGFLLLPIYSVLGAVHNSEIPVNNDLKQKASRDACSLLAMDLEMGIVI